MNPKSAVAFDDEDRILQALGSAIRNLRTAEGLSQEALAHAADLDRTYVSGVERGVRNTSTKAVWRLANALGVPPSKIFGQAEIILRESGG